MPMVVMTQHSNRCSVRCDTPHEPSRCLDRLSVTCCGKHKLNPRTQDASGRGTQRPRTFFTRVAMADLRDLLYTRAFSDVLCRCSAFCLASTWKIVARAGAGRREAA